LHLAYNDVDNSTTMPERNEGVLLRSRCALDQGPDLLQLHECDADFILVELTSTAVFLPGRFPTCIIRSGAAEANCPDLCDAMI
jgi:hypothetical protein